MKNTLLAAAALLLSACASVDTSLNGAPRMAAAGSSGTYYCWKERLATEGGNLVCNWEASATDACRSNGVVSIAKDNVASGPANSRRCENGQWLVTVSTK
jgi:hypothetical protein